MIVFDYRSDEKLREHLEAEQRYLDYLYQYPEPVTKYGTEFHHRQIEVTKSVVDRLQTILRIGTKKMDLLQLSTKTLIFTPPENVSATALRQICSRIVNIDKDQLTGAERSIAEILVEVGVAIWEETEED